MLGIDWGEFGEDKLAILEQITLARDDISHPPQIMSLEAYQGKQHFAKYTESFFASKWEQQLYERTGKLIRGTWILDVTPEKMLEAIELVDSFCQFMDGKWMSWRES